MINNEYERNLQLIQEIFPHYKRNFCEKWLKLFNGDVGRVCDYLATCPAAVDDDVGLADNGKGAFSSRLNSIKKNGRNVFGISMASPHESTDSIGSSGRINLATSSEFAPKQCMNDKKTFGKSKCTAKVLYPYEAQVPGELTISEGDIVTSVAKIGDGWCEGEVNGKFGIFPGSFVELDSLVKLKKLSGFKARVVVGSEAEIRDELPLKVGEVIDVIDTNVAPGWWRGRSKGKTGIFPTNFVEVVDEVSYSGGKVPLYGGDNVILRHSSTNSRIGSDQLPNNSSDKSGSKKFTLSSTDESVFNEISIEPRTGKATTSKTNSPILKCTPDESNKSENPLSKGRNLSNAPSSDSDKARSTISSQGTRIIYERKFLLDRKASPLSQTPIKLPIIPGVTLVDHGKITKEDEGLSILEENDGIQPTKPLQDDNKKKQDGGKQANAAFHGQVLFDKSWKDQFTPQVSILSQGNVPVTTDPSTSASYTKINDVIFRSVVDSNLPIDRDGDKSDKNLKGMIPTTTTSLLSGDILSSLKPYKSLENYFSDSFDKCSEMNEDIMKIQELSQSEEETLLNFFETKASSERRKQSEKVPNSSQEKDLKGRCKREAICGRVKMFNFEKKFGFICPLKHQSLKADNVKIADDTDVYFRLDRVRAYLFKPKAGDIVQYSLYEDKNKKTFAVNVILLKLERRDYEEVFDYLNLLDEEVTRSLEDNKVNSNVAQILGSPNIWNHLSETISKIPPDSRSSADSNAIVFKLLDLICKLDKIVKTLDESFRQMLSAVTNPTFFNPFNGRLRNVIQETKDRDHLDILKCFLLLIARYVPDKTQAVIALTKPIAKRGSPETNDFLFKMLQIISKMTSANIGDMEWDNMPLIMTNDEVHSPLISEQLNLKPVIVKGNYNSPYDYIDTYFRLLRTDCFSSLKKGIKDYLAGKLDKRDMNIYINIVIYGIELSKDSLTLALKVTPPKKIKNWDTSTCLMFGNLLCLSVGGNFKNLIWATVADRERLKTDNIVMVQSCYEFNSSNDGELIIEMLSSGVPIVMAESPTYYKAYQPVLKSLQAMDPDDISFCDEIVYLKRKYSPFYDENDTLDANLVYHNFDEERISIHDYIRNHYDLKNSLFDESQEIAVKRALRYRIGIIQGPPGTGKSFIGVQMLRMILSMPSSGHKKVLILTYKNHALDEFAKSALRFFPSSIVRIGGRSRDKDMDKISLRNVLREGKKTYEFNDQINSINDEIEQLKEDIERDFDELNKTSYISYSHIFSLLSPEQQLSIIRDCDWSKSNFPSFGLTDNEGFEIKRKKKGKRNKITSEEVAKILKDTSRNGEKIMRLAFAAFKQWVPEDGLFKQAAAILTGHGDICIKEEMQDKGERNKADEKDDVDVDEEERKLLEDERLTIQLKGRENKRIKKVEITKANDSIATFSITASKMLLSGDYDHLLCYENLWNLDQIQRVYFIQYLASKERKHVSEKFEENVNLFLQRTNQLSEIDNQITSKMLEDKQIIAMTITGASIHHKLLQQIRPEIVIVEEAAEILEPQLVAAIGTWSEYMLLIGDHFQLKPSVETYELKRDFHFDLSMMERLINNKMTFSTLQMQHRQREEFAELLKDIYPDLKTNLKSVTDNVAAKCLAKSSFFWDHKFPENKERSVTNEKEGERAVMLALFLIQQGYKPSQITILATYQGQTSLIRRCLKEKMQKHEKELGIRMTKEADDNIIVHTVDMYQGDENDFVIVSLVRSNEENKIGFLNERNRRCVAQSRARCGVYFIGNISMFRNHPIWKPMTDKLLNEGRIHDKLEIKCRYHPKMSYHITDITLKTFCKERCTIEMNCALHKCDRFCQPPHTHDVCKQMIPFTHVICGHRDIRKCMENPDHKRCESEVTFSFPNCPHTGKKRCYEDISTLLCKFEESVRFPACRHFIKKLCYQNINDLKCLEKCARKMDKCDHPCNHKCFEHASVNHCEDCDKIKKLEAEKQRKIEDALRRQNQKAVESEIEEIRKKIVMKGEVIREELKSDGSTAPEYFDIEDLVKKYIQPTHAWYPRVTKIEKVTNNFLRIKWLQTKRSLFDPEGRSVLKFHGTSDEGVVGITKDGFRLPTTGNPMYGFGVYFASDSSKSAQDMYTKGSNKLLLCEVLLGKPLTVEKACNNMNLAELKKKKCDSLFAKRGTREKGGVLYDEFVIFDPSQAYPKYIIHYVAGSCHNKPNAQLQFTDTFKTGRKSILPTRGLKADDPLDIHFRIAESQFLRLLNKLGQQNADLAVKEVEVYMNPILKMRFEKKMVEFENKYGSGKLESEFLLLFHGTKSRPVVEKIMDENFKCSTVGKFGPGVYFSEFPSYTFGYGGRDYLILSKVLPGKTFPARGNHPLEAGYDSHGGIPRNDTGGIRYSEIVIFNTDQILPCYVIHI